MHIEHNFSSQSLKILRKKAKKVRSTLEKKQWIWCQDSNLSSVTNQMGDPRGVTQPPGASVFPWLCQGGSTGDL